MPGYHQSQHRTDCYQKMSQGLVVSQFRLTFFDNKLVVRIHHWIITENIDSYSELEFNDNNFLSSLCEYEPAAAKVLRATISRIRLYTLKELDLMEFCILNSIALECKCEGH